jgi:hypothetical protein
VYWLGPLVGATVGAFAYGWLREPANAALPGEKESRREQYTATQRENER